MSPHKTIADIARHRMALLPPAIWAETRIWSARWNTIFETAGISEKLKALLAIAGKVQHSGKDVTAEDVARARRHGATDEEIHDAVLIAAAFCMYNRYVDGLATWAPADEDSYRQRAAHVAEHRYLGIPAAVAARQQG